MTKHVQFTNETKKYDGTCDAVSDFCAIVISFMAGQRKVTSKIIEINLNNMARLEMYQDELLVIKIRLEEIANDDALRSTLIACEIDPVSVIGHKNHSGGVPLARTGSREYPHRLLVENLTKINNLFYGIVVLLDGLRKRDESDEGSPFTFNQDVWSRE